MKPHGLEFTFFKGRVEDFYSCGSREEARGGGKVLLKLFEAQTISFLLHNQ